MSTTGPDPSARDGTSSRTPAAAAEPVLRSAVEGPSAPGIERFPRAFGKFVLKRRLARGGMADVFLASLSGAEGFEKELVVKLIRPELAADEGFVRRFVDEAKTCVRLTHPNIVSIFELGVETGILYLVMELVRGCTLAEVLHAGGALSPEEGAYVALEVARALDHAHRRGVVHRDVTPGNVMIDEEGSVKLLDFGVAARAGELSDVEVFGTPGHMPPEQIEGKPLSGTADLFALGTVLIESWTTRAPFRRGDARASRTAMLEPPAPPSATSADLAPLDELLHAVLALDPNERPQHADDVARVLRRYLRERGVDLDEVARGLAARVARAIAAREAREQGRPIPGAIARTHRPTPLGEVTRTFATRGEVGAWHGPSTRKIEDAPPSVRTGEASSAEVVERPSVTRKIDEPAERPAVVSPRGRRIPALLVVLLVASVAGAAYAAVSIFQSPPGPRNVRPPAVVSSDLLPANPTPSSTAGASTAPATATSAATVVTGSSAVPPTPSAPSSASTVEGTARLVVSSSPPANVEVDGRSMGSTTRELRLPCGDHRVVLRSQGLGESIERRVHLCPSGASIHGDFNDEPTVSVSPIPR